jgi:hypothetical protein
MKLYAPVRKTSAYTATRCLCEKFLVCAHATIKPNTERSAQQIFAAYPGHAHVEARLALLEHLLPKRAQERFQLLHVRLARHPAAEPPERARSARVCPRRASAQVQQPIAHSRAAGAAAARLHLRGSRLQRCVPVLSGSRQRILGRARGVRVRFGRRLRGHVELPGPDAQRLDGDGAEGAERHGGVEHEQPAVVVGAGVLVLAVAARGLLGQRGDDGAENDLGAASACQTRLESY